MPMLRKVFNKIGGMVLTAILAIFGAYFSTLLGIAIATIFVERNEMPDNALPFFTGAFFSFYLGGVWKKYTMSE